MTSFTFTVEQLKAAPPEVRHWALSQIEPAAMVLATAAPAPSATNAAALAACTADEAAQLFDLIRADVAAVQVFLELARDMPPAAVASPLYALSLAEIGRHTRLDNGRLVACLRLINRAFQQIRNDPETALFGFDQANHIFIHDTTHRSVRALWEELVGGAAPAAEEPATVDAAPADFLPPRVGPSEDIAAHRR